MDTNSLKNVEFLPIFYKYAIAWVSRGFRVYWNGKEIGMLEDTLTDVGTCMSFNLLNESYIFNTGTIDPNFLSALNAYDSNPSPNGWSIEEGYEDDFTSNHPRRSLSSKAELGFKMKHKHYMADPNIKFKCSLNEFVGVSVLIHFPGDWPQLKHHFTALPHSPNTIIVNPQLITTSESLKSYDPYQ